MKLIGFRIVSKVNFIILSYYNKMSNDAIEARTAYIVHEWNKIEKSIPHINSYFDFI